MSMSTSIPDARGPKLARDDGTTSTNVRVRAQPFRDVVAPGIRSPGAYWVRLVSTNMCMRMKTDDMSTAKDVRAAIYDAV
jgi:hypothetical protein